MNNRIFKTIRSDFAVFFRECPKINSSVGRKSTVVKEELYDQFMEKMIADERIDKDSKLLAAVLFSSGIRITEAMNLKVKQMDFETLRIRNVIIQKKRHKDLRLDKPIHPSCVAFLKEMMAGKDPEASIFGMETRHQGYRRLAKYFGISPHDARHSIANYFLAKNSKSGHKNSLERLTKLMGWSGLASAYNYSQNQDVDKELDAFFQ